MSMIPPDTRFNNDAVMPGLVPGIHVFLDLTQDVDGQDEPGHDDDQEICLA
jgi:hypothetical protein